MPELLVSDIAVSIELWCSHLGFGIAYERPEDTFAYLERPEGAQMLLSQPSGKWETAPLDRPYGRGVMFQVYVASIELVMLTAVWMHLDEAQRQLAMPNVSALARNGGVVIMSLRHGPVPPGRRINPIFT